MTHRPWVRSFVRTSTPEQNAVASNKLATLQARAQQARAARHKPTAKPKATIK